jgi:hypothetical protein
VKIEFDHATHTYRVDGRVVPSVTQIIAAAGLVKGSEWFTEESRWRGSNVHLACQYLDEGCLDRSALAPEYVPYVEAYERFKAETGFEPDLIEYSVCDMHGRFAGKLDRTGRIAALDGPVLIDIKTGAVQRTTELQTAAYAHCLSGGVMHRWAVRLCPENSPPYRITVYPKWVFAADYQRFIAALTVYETQKEFGIHD